MLNSKERAFLRKLGNPLETIFQVGKNGIGTETIKQVNEALEVRELIKLRVLETCEFSAKEAANEIADKTGSDVVQVIGSRFILYKQQKNKEKRKIEIKI